MIFRISDLRFFQLLSGVGGLQFRRNSLCDGLSASNRIFHRVIVPLTITSGGVDVSGLEVIDQILQMRLPVFVEHDVSGPDIEVQASEDTITWPQDTAAFQVREGSLERFGRVGLLPR